MSKNNPANSKMQFQTGHQHFIDWMKAVGMFLIVFGHVVGDPFNQFTAPVYPKQLGVAFFFFIMGWSLANEKRPVLQVAFYRLFPIYLWGVSAAVILSGIMLVVKNDLNLSNYMPFFLGINVFFDYFPANPTTWYIGTYIQFVLLWVVFLRRIRVNKRIIIISLLTEVISRTFLISINKLYIGYMLIPNWITIFLLGMYFHQKRDTSRTGAILLMFVWIIGLSAWGFLGKHMHFDNSFPFKQSNLLRFPLNSLLVSMCVSIVYLLNTYVFFEISRRVHAGQVVRFFSRNTLIIFIWHMPLLYSLYPWWYSIIDSTWIKKTTIIIIMYVGLAAVSELAVFLSKPKMLRDKIWIPYGKEISSKLSWLGLTS